MEEERREMEADAKDKQRSRGKMEIRKEEDISRRSEEGVG
jgi:hypothetical protein